MSKCITAGMVGFLLGMKMKECGKGMCMNRHMGSAMAASKTATATWPVRRLMGCQKMASPRARAIPMAHCQGGEIPRDARLAIMAFTSWNKPEEGRFLPLLCIAVHSARNGIRLYSG